MNIHIRAISFHRYQSQITSKIPRILSTIHISTNPDKRAHVTYQSRQWQSISKSCHRSLKIGSLKVLINALSRHSRIHVCPNKGNGATRNSPALIGDFDGDILLALNNDNFDGRVWLVVSCIVAKAVDDSTEGVFEEFETDVGKMAWDIGEDEVGRADKLNRGAFEHGVVFLADEAGIFDSFLYDIMYILRRMKGVSEWGKTENGNVQL